MSEFLLAAALAIVVLGLAGIVSQEYLKEKNKRRAEERLSALEAKTLALEKQLDLLIRITKDQSK